MSLAAVRGRPAVWLVRWRVACTNLGTRHFIGHSVEDDKAYVSTPILTYEHARSTGLASNGRRCTVMGPPGYDKEAEFVWRFYIRLWGLNEAVDVSGEYQLNSCVMPRRDKHKGGNGSVAPRLYGIRREQS